VTLSHVSHADETEVDIETRVAPETKALEAIATIAEEYDAVVVGESDPSLTTFVFGMPAEKLVERFLGPVPVVQREKPDSGPPEAGYVRLSSATVPSGRSLRETSSSSARSESSPRSHSRPWSPSGA